MKLQYFKKVVKKIKVVGKEAKVSVRIDVSLPIMMVILQLIINNFVFVFDVYEGSNKSGC